MSDGDIAVKIAAMPVDDWTSSAFLDEVSAWTREQLAAQGTTLTGEWHQPHARPWSSAIRFETEQAAVWFKVNGPGTRTEPALTALLGRHCPGLVPDVLAVDTDRGWWLSRDAGPTMRSVVDVHESWPAWDGLLRRYARAQLVMAGHAEEALGTAIRRVTPDRSPRLVRDLVDELSVLPEARGGLTPADRSALEARLPAFDGWCAELSASGLPDTVQHDDLHDGNICWSGSAARARIIDWGDTSWGCPLSTLPSTMSSLRHHSGLDESAAPLRRLQDSYLDEFSAYGDRAGLQHLAELARRTACLGKALSWRAALLEVDTDRQAELGFPVRAWLLDLLDLLAR